MRRLILLRHAKASSKDAARDAERPLAARGRAQMVAVAAHLAADGGLTPDLALVSPSARTRETWTLAGLPGVATRFEPGIYEATVGTLLAILRGVDPGVATLALIGHNPGTEELADALVGDGDAAARAGMRAGFPTGALAVLDFAAASWRDVAAGSGRLDRFVTPAALGVPKGEA